MQEAADSRDRQLWAIGNALGRAILDFGRLPPLRGGEVLKPFAEKPDIVYWSRRETITYNGGADEYLDCLEGVPVFIRRSNSGRRKHEWPSQACLLSA